MEGIIQELGTLDRLVGRGRPGLLLPLDIERLELSCRSIRVCLREYRGQGTVRLVCYRTKPASCPIDEFTLIDALLLPNGEETYKNYTSPTSLYLKYHPLKRWGLHSCYIIPKNSHILPYYGEVIHSRELSKRRELYDEKVRYVPVVTLIHGLLRVSTTCSSSRSIPETLISSLRQISMRVLRAAWPDSPITPVIHQPSWSCLGNHALRCLDCRYCRPGDA